MQDIKKNFLILHNEQEFPPMRTVLLSMLPALFLACSSPKNPSAPNDNLMKFLPSFDLQGHRGARGLLPENTIPAFERALQLGVSTLEMDVAITKDSQVVVSHEPWFSGHICTQPNGRPVPLLRQKKHRIYDLTYEEVKQYDCGLRGNPGFPDQTKMPAHKPLLSEVIQFAETFNRDPSLPPILYNIETKTQPQNDGIFHPDPTTFTTLLLNVLEEYDILGRATIQSFDPRTLRIARDQKPGLSLALLVGSHDKMSFSEHIENLGFQPQIYSPNYKLVDEQLIHDAHALEIQVIPWTINTMEEMEKLLELGVDGIITDYPDVGRQLLFRDRE